MNSFQFFFVTRVNRFITKEILGPLELYRVQTLTQIVRSCFNFFIQHWFVINKNLMNET